MAISCVYCGGVHARPADVRRCWEAQSGPADVAAGVTAGVTAGVAAHTVAGDAPVVDPAPAGALPARRGPAALGRNVVVGPGAPAPDEWHDAERLVVPAAVVTDPAAVLERLRGAARAGRALILELHADPAPTAPADGAVVTDRDPYELGPGFGFDLDDLHHLVWSNAVDARDPATPRWAPAEQAVRLGATACRSGRGDVTLPDGTDVWIDGGPVRRLDPIDGVPVVHGVVVEHGRLDPPGGDDGGADLATDQLAAVTHRGGAARIIAPAGSGKTRVLTERARHLLRTWCVPASAVGLVAFNKRAQEEMAGRTRDLRGLQVRTLNSIALAVINGAPPFAPQQRTWTTIDEPEVRRILGRFVESPRRLNVDPLAPWIDALSLVRLGLLAPAEVESRYGGDVDGLTEVYPRYLAALERDGVVDFDGQIHRALRVLLTQPVARRAAQRASRLLLVDEFQDLTPAHLLLVRLLAGPGGSVFGVGDDDQTIYGYNGADPSWLIDFDRWFPGAGDHPLEVNYRCPADVVACVDRLLRHNRRRVAKTIRSASSVTDGLVTVVVDDAVGATVDAVRAALDAGALPGEVAVLTRVNALLAPVQVALAAAGVPIAGGVGAEFADRTAVRAALAWLRLAASDSFAATDLAEALRRPSRGLHPRIRDWVGEQRDLAGLHRLAGRLTDAKDADRVTDFAGDIARLRAMVGSGTPTRRLVDTLVADVGLGGAVATLDRNRSGMNRSAQGDDLRSLAQLAALHPDPTTFEAWLRGHLVVRRDPEGVVLATVHRVKGQEWPHVVVHQADAEQFPHRLSEDVEEERRLFHVAVTRASRRVTVVAETPSRFIAELRTEPPDPARVGAPPPVPVRSTPKPAPPAAAAPDHPLLDRTRVVAAAGLVLVDQGQEWVVVSTGDEGAVTERAGAVRVFRFGSRVETAGRQRGVLQPCPAGVSPVGVVVFDRLRSFREGARHGKPAYTVFDDRTLAAIATELPQTPADLAGVRGIGPAKLEQYGDDVLDVVRSVTEPA